ncbi:MAG: prepilin peptidase [Firmicutes bacterium]|nr:prepilin peptidase [Bacillota bacterium]
MTRLYILSVFIPCFARLCYTDIKYKELEHLFIFLLLLGAFFTDVPLLLRIAGALVPFAFFKLLGFGDVLLLSVLGFVFGIYDFFEIFAFASVSSGIVCALGLLLKKVKKEDTLPFAPYICSACLIFLIREMLL